MSTETIDTIPVLAERLPEAIKALEKLVKKARRYGNPDIAYTVGPVRAEERRVTDWDGRSRKVTVHVHDVTVTGEAPRVGSHEFLARVELGPAGNIIDKRPGVDDLDARFRHTDSHCDHCGVDRDRREVFVLRDLETESLVQIGRTCLRDYLGIDDPSHVAGRFRFLRELREWGEEGWGRAPWVHSMEGVLALAAVAIRLFGWCSKGQAAIDDTLTPTVEYVRLGLVYDVAGLSRSEREDWDRIHKALGEEDHEVARATIAWVQSLEGRSDYEHNLTVLFRDTALTDPKRLGLVVSAVAGYHRAQEKALRLTRERQDRAASGWVGQEGERLRGLLVTLDSQRSVGGNSFGDLVLIKLRDEAGNVLSWFTGGGTGHNTGTQFRLDGTVKRHTEYQGAKETQLTRCKLTPIA